MGEAAAVENIVTQHQGHRGIGNKIGPQYEGLGQAVGAGLDGIAQLNTPLPAITQQFGKRRLVLGGGDNQDLPNAGPHQGGQGVVDHRFVIHRHQLLADRAGQGVESGTRASRQDDAFVSRCLHVEKDETGEAQL